MQEVPYRVFDSSSIPVNCDDEDSLFDLSLFFDPEVNPVVQGPGKSVSEGPWGIPAPGGPI